MVKFFLMFALVVRLPISLGFFILNLQGSTFTFDVSDLLTIVASLTVPTLPLAPRWTSLERSFDFFCGVVDQSKFSRCRHHVLCSMQKDESSYALPTSQRCCRHHLLV